MVGASDLGSEGREFEPWPVQPCCVLRETLNLSLLARPITIGADFTYYITIITSRRLFCHNPVSRGTNQPIRKSEFLQCMKVE